MKKINAKKCLSAGASVQHGKEPRKDKILVCLSFTMCKKSNTNKSRLSQSPFFVLGALVTRFSRLRRGLVGFAVDLQFSAPYWISSRANTIARLAVTRNQSERRVSESRQIIHEFTRGFIPKLLHFFWGWMKIRPPKILLTLYRKEGESTVWRLTVITVITV